ncbi:hypothetical protein SNEBB_001235 [Seison nebaliae]|nr:hypothetical protein SNEBB_001235 [Seison nebaliae]
MESISIEMTSESEKEINRCRSLRRKNSQPNDTFEYVVKNNDTVESIAAHFNTTPTIIMHINRLVSRYSLFPNQLIYVPDAKKEEEMKLQRQKLEEVLSLKTEKVVELKEAKFLKFPVKYLKDDDDSISGILLLTPTALLFDNEKNFNIVINSSDILSFSLYLDISDCCCEENEGGAIKSGKNDGIQSKSSSISSPDNVGNENGKEGDEEEEPICVQPLKEESHFLPDEFSCDIDSILGRYSHLSRLLYRCITNDIDDVNSKKDDCINRNRISSLSSSYNEKNRREVERIKTLSIEKHSPFFTSVPTFKSGGVSLSEFYHLSSSFKLLFSVTLSHFIRHVYSDDKERTAKYWFYIDFDHIDELYQFLQSYHIELDENEKSEKDEKLLDLNEKTSNSFSITPMSEMRQLMFLDYKGNQLLNDIIYINSLIETDHKSGSTGDHMQLKSLDANFYVEYNRKKREIMELMNNENMKKKKQLTYETIRCMEQQMMKRENNQQPIFIPKCLLKEMMEYKDDDPSISDTFYFYHFPHLQLAKEEKSADRNFIRLNIHKCWEFVDSEHSYEEMRRIENLLELTAIPPQLNGKSLFLTTQQTAVLNHVLPPRAVGYIWKNIFNTSDHGYSLGSLYRHMPDEMTPILIVIQDTNKDIFGVCASQKLEIRHGSSFYGSGESLLFKFTPQFTSYGWSGTNNFCMISDLNFMAFGCSEGKYGLMIDNDLNRGTTHSCATYANEPLISNGNDFMIAHLEIWAFLD